MKFTISNLGPIGSAELTIAPLTIICGKNNTGKTYVSYSYFGVTDFIRYGLSFPVNDEMIDDLINIGVISVNLKLPQEFFDLFFEQASDRASDMLPVIFAAPPAHFKRSAVKLSVNAGEIRMPATYSKTFTAGNSLTLQLNKAKGSDALTIAMINSNSGEPLNASQKALIKRSIGSVLKEVLFNEVLPDKMFASAERTGALIFRDELTPEKGQDVGSLFRNHIDDLEGLLEDVSSSLYPFPIIKNINFVKNLRGISLGRSSLAQKYPALVAAFDRISGGQYTVDEKGVFFSPADNPSLKLAMEESSSSVRSLVIVSFWLRHLAKKGDLLMIDEPEMNLHPEGQRLLARWIAMLVNYGVKVFITTHSDYLIKELNTLVMLRKKQNAAGIAPLMEKNGISKSMLLNPKELKVYVAKRPVKYAKDGTSVPGKTVIEEAAVDPFYGVSVSSFDDTISRINDLQEAIIFNG